MLEPSLRDYSAKATNEETHLTRGPTKPDLGPTPPERFAGATSKETPPDAFDLLDVVGPQSDAILASQGRIEANIENLDGRISRIEQERITKGTVVWIVISTLAAIAGIIVLVFVILEFAKK